MIKILKPDDYQPLRKDETTREEIGSRLHYEEQSSQSEDQYEVEVVDTEQRGNNRVYRLSNCILIAFAVFLLAAFYAENHMNARIQVDGIEYVEVPTNYVVQIDGKIETLTYFLPESMVQSKEETAKVAQMCLKQRDHDCWKEVLISRKTMFPEVQVWMEQYLQEYTNRILVMWEERLSLAILLINLKADRKHMIDIYFQDGDSAEYLECLKINLRRFKLLSYVRFMRKPEMKVALLRQYGLVMGSSDLLHKVIEPELLQFSVFAGRGDNASGSIYQFTLDTKLMLFYEHLPNYQETLILDSMYNQLVRLSLSAEGRLEQEEIGSLRAQTNVILLDRRQRPVNTTASNPVQEQPKWETDSISIPIGLTQQPLIPALREMRRVQPSRLLRFFECTLSSKEITSKGSAYTTEFRGLSLLRSAYNDKDWQLSHIYNFVLQYLLAADYCNVLLAGQEELLANIVTVLNTGQVYLSTTNSSSWPRIQASLSLNGFARRLKKVEIDSAFSDFLRSSQIGLALLTPAILTIYNKIFRQTLQGNMNLLVRLDEANSDDLLRPFLQDHYIFIISQDSARNYDTQCVRNFGVEYFAGGQIPKNSFALISKNDILFEQPNPLLYANLPSERTIHKERHRCFNDFSNDPIQLNLQGGVRAVAVSGKVSLFIQGSASLAYQAIHAEQGIIQFLQQSITVSDKLLVYSQPVPHMLILIHLLKKLQAHGQAYLAGLNEEQTPALEKNVDLNSISGFYELINAGQQLLSTLIENTNPTVVLTSMQILKKEPGVLSKLPKASMVLLKYESSDKDFIQMLRQSKFKVMQISSATPAPDDFGLCSSYQATPLSQSQLPSATAPTGSWLSLFT